MRHALWLWLVLVGVAHASDPALIEPRLAVSLASEPALTLTLDPALVPVALSLPCLGCRAGLRAATEHYAKPEAEPAPPAPVASKTTVTRRPLAIGDTWKLGNKRVFSIHLTPTPEECAPLVRLMF